jgi:2-haloacid dehalogenase
MKLPDFKALSFESLFHDHLPANKAGLASAWIHRRYAQEGFGATRPPDTLPHYDFKFTTLAEMARAHRELNPGSGTVGGGI